MIDPVANRSRFLEQQPVYTLLGIRFWDPASSDVVSRGLDVWAWPEGQPEATSKAFRTGAGVYAFRGLAGLRHLEYPAAGVDPWTATPVRFVVQALDARRRYLPLVFAVNVPHRGIFPSSALRSPVVSAAPGCWLFSAPTRMSRPALGVVRAHLLEAGSTVPLAHAVVEVTLAGATWYGISDERGQVAVFFPLPSFTSQTGFASPPSAMPEQSWPVNVRVRHAVPDQETPAGAIAPDVRTLFSQPARDIWLTSGGATAASLTTDLFFGEELVLQTAGETTLWLEPVSSPI